MQNPSCWTPVEIVLKLRLNLCLIFTFYNRVLKIMAILLNWQFPHTTDINAIVFQETQTNTTITVLILNNTFRGKFSSKESKGAWKYKFWCHSILKYIKTDLTMFFIIPFSFDLTRVHGKLQPSYNIYFGREIISPAPMNIQKFDRRLDFKNSTCDLVTESKEIQSICSN